jgi:hypothetical protein
MVWADDSSSNRLALSFDRGVDDPPVGVRICDAVLVFNVLWPEGHLEPNCHFAFLDIP